MPGKIIVKSAEFIASSESESESESGIPNVNVRSSAPQTSNRKRKHASPTSTSTKRAKTTPISSSRRKQSLSSGVSSESEDDSRSASKDDSGHSVDKNEGEPDRTVVDPMGSPNHIESPTLIVRTSPPPYEVPDGFECSVLNSQCSTTLEQLFTPSNLTGKQIWNITAPAGVPLSNIKEVAQAHVKKGDKILSFNGNDYSFVSGNLSDTIDMKLLVPTENGTAYRTVQASFVENLHLRQVVPTRGPENTGSQTAALLTLPIAREVRRQPKGLRTRWWPAGFER